MRYSTGDTTVNNGGPTRRDGCVAHPSTCTVFATFFAQAFAEATGISESMIARRNVPRAIAITSPFVQSKLSPQ